MAIDVGPTHIEQLGGVYPAGLEVERLGHLETFGGITTIDVTVLEVGARALRADTSAGTVYSQLNSLRTARTELTDNGLIFVAYRDGHPGLKGLSEVIAASRQNRYKDEGLLKKEAGSTDSIRGPHVEILVLLDVKVEGRPVVSLRKIHASKNGAIEELPSHAKFEEKDAFSPEGRELMQSRTAGRPVVEIGALWKERGYKPDAQFELYKRGIQDGIVRGEVWFMGVVTPVYRRLVDTFGPQVIKSLGEPIRVEGEDAVDSVRINPTLVDPMTFFDDMMDGIEAARAREDDRDAAQKEFILWHFLEGLDLRLLPEATVDRLRSIA